MVDVIDDILKSKAFKSTNTCSRHETKYVSKSLKYMYFQYGDKRRGISFASK